MRTYDNYFQSIRHIEQDIPEAFTWKGVDSTGLAEVMELADKHGYEYRLNCYDEVLHITTGADMKSTDVNHHVREMIFIPRK